MKKIKEKKMKNKILRMLKSFLFALTLTGLITFLNISETPCQPADTTGNLLVTTDGGIITPIDTMRRYIEYYTQIRNCLKICPECLETVTLNCDLICQEICDTLSETDTTGTDNPVESGIFTPTDSYERAFAELVGISEHLLEMKKFVELKLLYMKKIKNTFNVNSYKSILIRLNYLIANYDLLLKKIAFKKCSDCK